MKYFLILLLLSIFLQQGIVQDFNCRAFYHGTGECQYYFSYNSTIDMNINRGVLNRIVSTIPNQHVIEKFVKGYEPYSLRILDKCTFYPSWILNGKPKTANDTLCRDTIGSCCLTDKCEYTIKPYCDFLKGKYHGSLTCRQAC